MEKQFSIAEAKNRLTSIIRDVETGPPAVFTRYGRKVAVLLSIDDYEKLKPRKKGLKDTFDALREIIENEKIVFTDSDFAGLREGGFGRKVEFGE